MKKYAIVILKNLNIKKFDHKDDLQCAVNSLTARDEGFIVLKYNHGASTYAVPEVVI